MKISSLFLVVCALLVASPDVRASTVNINLGLSTQNYTLTGQGSNGTFGTFLDEQGACSTSAGVTTCNLSGLYTGATPGFTGGTYDLVTTYNAATPLKATEFGTNSFGFGPTDIGAGTTMFLDLVDLISGSHHETIYNGSFVGGYFIFFGPGTTCTGASPCTQDNVGLTPGAVISGPVSGGASFDIPDPNVVPEPNLLVLGGLPGLLLMVRRRLLKR